MQSQLMSGSNARPQLLVYRSGTRHSIQGDEDTELQPGDTVFVALRGDALVGQMMR
jgi:hypothetical protein